MTQTSTHTALCQVLVGRDAERDLLRRAVEHTQLGNLQTMLVAGEAGIGKSRLLREAKAAAAVRGYLVLQGNCFQPDLACPYAPLLDLLRASATREGPVFSRERLAPYARELRPLLPDLAGTANDQATLPALDPEQEKRRLFAALADLFIAQSAAQPLLMVIEDIHWSDDTSLEFLSYLMRRCEDHPVLLLLSYRNDAYGTRLRHWLAQVDRERAAQEIVLQPLTPQEIESMLRAMLQLDVPVRTEFLDPIYALVEGNPFVLEEVLRSLIATGDVFFAEGHWERKPMSELRIPRSVQDAVQVRLEQLGPLGRRVLQLAAVAGRRFDFALMQRLSDLDEEALVARFKEMVAAQLMVEESADRFAFRHALTHQTIYAGLLARERKALHRTIAGVIEDLYAETLDTHLGDLATHYYEAGEWAPALAYAQRAGEKAQALFAPQAVAEHMTKALLAAGQLDAPGQGALRRTRGHAFEVLGSFERARIDYEAALEEARLENDRLAEWQSLIDLGKLWTARDYARTGDYFEQAFALAIELNDPMLRAQSLNRVGNWYSNRDHSPEALSYHEEALAIFEELDDRQGIADTVDLLGMANLLATDLLRSKAHYDRSISLFRTLDDRQGLSSSLAARGMVSPSYQLDSSVPAAWTPQDSVLDCEQALKVSRDIGYRPGESFALWTLAAALGPQGQFARALEAARLSVRIADDIEHRQWMCAARCTLGTVYFDLLAYDQARATLEDALRLARESGSVHWMRNATGHLAQVYLAQGDNARARAVLDSASDPDMPMHTIGQRLAWRARIQLAQAQGNAAAALELADAMISAAPNHEAGPPIPRLERMRGEALCALRRLPEAETALLAALDTATKYGVRSSEWRIQLALSKVYLGQRRTEEAAQACANVRAILAQCAQQIDDDALREHFVEETAAMLPRSLATSPRRAARAAFDGLTAREREVAALITKGLSNHALAEVLIVSERTVETHVSSILVKLGFASRAQIAAWAVEKGLTQPGATPGSMPGIGLNTPSLAENREASKRKSP